MVDRDKLRAKIAFIETNLRRLKRIAALPVEEFTEESNAFHAAIRLLQVSIEAMLDIGNHIIAQERLGIPKTYGEVFELLGKGGVIPSDFVATGRQMARFRNRAVHLYADISEGEVYNILQNHLGDFQRFISFIVRKYF